MEPTSLTLADRHVPLASSMRTEPIGATPVVSWGKSSEAKLTICHRPPGSPGKRHSITVGASAWPARQAHGDTEGHCE